MRMANRWTIGEIYRSRVRRLIEFSRGALPVVDRLLSSCAVSSLPAPFTSGQHRKEATETPTPSALYWRVGELPKRRDLQ